MKDTMILECKNLSCFYGNIKAVDDVNFSINSGDYLCVVGANGSGKSTLVKTILGLHKNFSGSIKKESGLLHSLYFNDYIVCSCSVCVIGEKLHFNHITLI